MPRAIADNDTEAGTSRSAGYLFKIIKVGAGFIGIYASSSNIETGCFGMN